MIDGRGFEERVFEEVRQTVMSGGFGLLPEVCHVYHQRAYYSRERERDILVDVSIELVLPGAARPSLIWIWECKDYSRAVPVSDIEELHAKLQQIGADNTKGTLITTSTLQAAALNYAVAHGIGVARLLPMSRIQFATFAELKLDDEQRRKLSEGIVWIRDPHPDAARSLTRWALTDAPAELIGGDRRFFGVDTMGGIAAANELEAYIEREFILSGLHHLPIWSTGRRKRGWLDSSVGDAIPLAEDR